MKTLLLFVLLLLPQISLAEVMVINYHDLPHYVQNQNNKIKSKEFLLESKASTTNHLFRSFLPQVNISSGIQNFKTADLDFKTQPRLNVNAGINLFNGGRDLLENKIRDYQYKIAQLNLKNEFLEQLTLARFLFAECFYFKDQIKTSQNILDHINTLDQQTRIKENSGLVSSTDLNSIQLYSYQLKSDLVLLKEDYEHTLDQLKVTLGIQLDKNVELQANYKKKKSLSHVEVDGNYPMIKKIENEMMISDYLRKKYQLWWIPSIDVFSSYDLYTFREREYFNYENRDEYVLGFQINIPLFDKLSSHSKSKVEKYKSKALQAELEHYQQELKAELEKLQHGLDVRKELITNYRNIIELSEKTIEQVKKEYLDGIKNSLDVISTYDSFLIQHQKYSTYIRDYFMIEAKLMSLTNNNI